jgi:hypothetical protein
MGRRIAQTVWTTEQNYKAAAGNLFTTPPATGMNVHSWNTQKDGFGDTYYAGDAINVTGDMTLYATWIRDFSPTATTEDIIINMSGKYKLEAWGGQGGQSGGLGGYAAAEFTFNAGQGLYVRVGKQTGFNGGGGKGSPSYNMNLVTSFKPDLDTDTNPGGGATDFRINDTDPCTGVVGTDPRILVAGGGGGRQAYVINSNAGGGENGGSAIIVNGSRTVTGGTQTEPGHENNDEQSKGAPGCGGTGFRRYDSGQEKWGANGGGGWYGGGGQAVTGGIGAPAQFAGSGGSGYAPPGGLNIRGDESFIQPDGSTAVGKSVHGFARITYLGE